MPNVGVVPPEPVWLVNVGEIYADVSIGADHQVPIDGQLSLGLSAKMSITPVTLLRVWDTGPGRWNFASSITPSYLWTKVGATLAVGGIETAEQQSASNLFDLYFTPLIAGYHVSETENIALSFNVWAPTGKYSTSNIANTSLNNWTFIPQVAYTKLWPESGFEIDAVMGVQFYTRNTATNYQNAPLFTLDVLGLKRFGSGMGVGLVAGTVQQLGNDSGPLAEKLNGFVGSDWTVGPVLTYDTKLAGMAPLSFSIRWIPTVSGRNRLEGNSTVMATATLIFK